MKISMHKLINVGADNDLLAAYNEHGNGLTYEIEAASLVGSNIPMIDLIWIADKLGTKSKLIRFACDLILLKYANIKGHCSYNTYHTIKRFLQNPDATFCFLQAKRYVKHVWHIDIFNHESQISDVANCVRALFTGIKCREQGLAGLAGAAYHIASIMSKQVPKEKIDQLLIELLS